MNAATSPCSTGRLPMQLERATLADIPNVVSLMNLAFRGTGPEASWNTEAPYIEGDRTTEALLALEMAERPEALLLLHRADDGSTLNGCVWLEPAGAGVWYLGSLAILPRLQKGGMGRRLLAAAEDIARDNGATIIRMKVVNVRNTLIAWYERRGYRVTQKTEAFPQTDHRFGRPLRDDLCFVVLEKAL